jgi:hypothetical protein
MERYFEEASNDKNYRFFVTVSLIQGGKLES